jgi:peptidoglycan lytic transglycosylase F
MLACWRKRRAAIRTPGKTCVKTENGYARGWEPVRYVENVRGYRDLLEWAWGDGPNSGVLN